MGYMVGWKDGNAPPTPGIPGATRPLISFICHA